MHNYDKKAGKRVRLMYVHKRGILIKCNLEIGKDFKSCIKFLRKVRAAFGDYQEIINGLVRHHNFSIFFPISVYFTEAK